MFSYRLPRFSDNLSIESINSDTSNRHAGMNYKLIGNPIGAFISVDGTLEWKTEVDTNETKNSGIENKVEIFVVKVVGPCEHETAVIEISVYVYGDSPTSQITYG